MASQPFRIQYAAARTGRHPWRRSRSIAIARPTAGRTRWRTAPGRSRPGSSRRRNRSRPKAQATSRTQRQPIQERGDHVLRVLAVLCPQRQKGILDDEAGKET